MTGKCVRPYRIMANETKQPAEAELKLKEMAAEQGKIVVCGRPIDVGQVQDRALAEALKKMFKDDFADQLQSPDATDATWLKEFIRKQQLEAVKKVDKRSEGMFMLATVNADKQHDRDPAQMLDLFEKLCTKYAPTQDTVKAACVEWRWEDYDPKSPPTQPKGLHMHIYIDRTGTKVKPNLIEKTIRSVFKSVCDTENRHCCNFKQARDGSNFLNYVNGVKSSEYKQEWIALDRQWRDYYKVPHVFSSEEYDESDDEDPDSEDPEYEVTDADLSSVATLKLSKNPALAIVSDGI